MKKETDERRPFRGLSWSLEAEEALQFIGRKTTTVGNPNLSSIIRQIVLNEARRMGWRAEG